jgi:hypothetical protein
MRIAVDRAKRRLKFQPGPFLHLFIKSFLWLELATQIKGNRDERAPMYGCGSVDHYSDLEGERKRRRVADHVGGLAGRN